MKMATDTDVSSTPTTTAPTDAPTPITSSGHDGASRTSDEAVGWGWGWDWNCNSIPCLFQPGSAGFQGQREDGDPEHRTMGPSIASRSVEELSKRSLDHFPNPNLLFPSPALEFDFRIAVKLNPELSRSETRVHKEIITVSSGKWSGTFGNGNILAGGYDLGQARGFRPIRIVEGAFVLRTDEQAPAVFEMRTRGSLSGPCNILDILLSPRKSKDIDPRQYSFRMFCTVKAADKRYAELVNCGLWVASGIWKGEELIIDAFRVT